MPELLRPSSEAEMVFEFVKAELESPIYEDRCKISPAYSRDELIEYPDLNNREHNAARLNMLFYRGYLTRSWLFSGFPYNVEWSLKRFSLAELGAFRYCNAAPWSILVDKGRLVKDGVVEIKNAVARALSLKVPVSAVLDVRRQYEQGKRFPRLIAVEVDRSHVLVEGHSRATAFVGSRVDRRVEVLVGRSENITGWVFR